MKDWLHDCYFSAVAGDAPAFEAWPSQEEYMLHEYILALWGMPLGEMFDLEKLAKTCREKGRWTFFVTSKEDWFFEFALPAFIYSCCTTLPSSPVAPY